MLKKQTNELGRVSAEEYKSMEKNSIILVADNIRSLNNVGSLFRTGDAFAVEAVYLCGITATPPNKEIHKTALGAEMIVNWEYFVNTVKAVEKLKHEGYTVIAVEQVKGSTDLRHYDINAEGRYALIFGNEVKGVGQEVIDMCDLCIEIPQNGTKHSLNVSVSAGIVLWEFFKIFAE